MQENHFSLWEEAEALLKKDPVLKGWMDRIGSCKLAKSLDGTGSEKDEKYLLYFALCRAVIAQQISTRAAEAIFEKMCRLGDNSLPLPHILSAAEDESLRQCGLSRQKIRYLREVAQRAEKNCLPDRQSALNMGEAKLRTLLTEIPGIGDWSADMVMILSLHHPDILAAGDYGVREGYRLIYGLEQQVSAKMILKAGTVFAPFRSVFTWYCWAVKEYVQTKRNEG